jgi:hypothetical protein
MKPTCMQLAKQFTIWDAFPAQILTAQLGFVSNILHPFFRKKQAWYVSGLFFYSIGVCLENFFRHTVIIKRR